MDSIITGSLSDGGINALSLFVTDTDGELPLTALLALLTLLTLGASLLLMLPKADRLLATFTVLMLLMLLRCFWYVSAAGLALTSASLAVGLGHLWKQHARISAIELKLRALSAQQLQPSPTSNVISAGSDDHESPPHTPQSTARGALSDSPPTQPRARLAKSPRRDDGDHTDSAGAAAAPAPARRVALADMSMTVMRRRLREKGVHDLPNTRKALELLYTQHFGGRNDDRDAKEAAGEGRARPAQHA